MTKPRTGTGKVNAEIRISVAAAGYLEGSVFRLLRRLFQRGRRHRPPVMGAGTNVVACLGASATDARASYDWIADLAQRPRNAHLRFYRFAEGGDLAYNGLQRVPDLIGRQPDYVVILLGNNDVLALISKKVAQFDRLTKQLPRTSSPEWYQENMQAIVHRLKAGTQARIGLCSLIPIGEDPNSSSAFQADLNRYVEEFSAIVKSIAHQEAVGYIPVYERIHELVCTTPGRAFTSFDFLPFYRDMFRQFVLHKSNDAIGQLNGWRYHRDGIHLNSRSGKLVAELVHEFLQTPAERDATAIHKRDHADGNGL
jgi:lysophospholipase L1-like esterase